MYHGTTAHDVDPTGKVPTSIVHAGFSLFVSRTHKDNYKKYKAIQDGNTKEVEDLERQSQGADSSDYEQSEEETFDSRLP